jgi:hypothetical protein
VPIVLKSGGLNLLEPFGLSRPVIGTALPFTHALASWLNVLGAAANGVKYGIIGLGGLL